ncbi:DUF5320 domain-containing protein [Candidatus Pacearchaeota archaeon]|nr:DUF5320 domain-containing protein [Candidatus Pacearchaeota archaeon]
MPAMDRTGPLGQGALTGRRLGPCGRGFAKRLGIGRGLGRGLGFRARAFLEEPVTLTEAEEKKILEAELKEIEDERKEVEKRLKELKA